MGPKLDFCRIAALMAHTSSGQFKSPDSDGVYFNVPRVVVVTWHPPSRSVCAEWQSWASSEEFAGALDAGLRCLMEHGAAQWLADCSGMRAIKQSDQEWISNDWFPRALAAGLKRMAVVDPTSVLPRMNVNDIMGKVPASELEVANFQTVAEAKEWLERPFIKTPTNLHAKSA